MGQENIKITNISAPRVILGCFVIIAIGVAMYILPLFYVSSQPGLDEGGWAGLAALVYSALLGLLIIPGCLAYIVLRWLRRIDTKSEASGFIDEKQKTLKTLRKILFPLIVFWATFFLLKVAIINFFNTH